eukprot:3525028-Amphidinium_carterae.2
MARSPPSSQCNIGTGAPKLRQTRHWCAVTGITFELSLGASSLVKCVTAPPSTRSFLSQRNAWSRLHGAAWKAVNSGAGAGNKKSLCGSNDCNSLRAWMYGVHHTN